MNKQERKTYVSRAIHSLIKVDVNREFTSQTVANEAENLYERDSIFDVNCLVADGIQRARFSRRKVEKDLIELKMKGDVADRTLPNNRRLPRRVILWRFLPAAQRQNSKA